MPIKFANEVVQEIRQRGTINMPEGYINGEAYEECTYERKDKPNEETDSN